LVLHIDVAQPGSGRSLKVLGGQALVL
jgi:hypothetical protein